MLPNLIFIAMTRLQSTSWSWHQHWSIDLPMFPTTFPNQGLNMLPPKRQTDTTTSMHHHVSDTTTSVHHHVYWLYHRIILSMSISSSAVKYLPDWCHRAALDGRSEPVWLWPVLHSSPTARATSRANRLHFPRAWILHWHVQLCLHLYFWGKSLLLHQTNTKCKIISKHVLVQNYCNYLFLYSKLQ